MIYPNNLKKGDIIKIISPSNGVKNKKINLYENALNNLERFGFSVIEDKYVRSSINGVSSTAKNRAVEFNKAIDNKNIKNILLNAEYLILNSDINVKIDLIENLDLKVITYGFNSKSTVTASSVTEEEMLICVQRNIINIKGKKIEPQEINIEKDIMLDNYDNMYIMCLATIYGKM